MSLGELLGRVVGILTRLEVPYMLTGSLAAAHYSLPRATQDVDLVIEQCQRFTKDADRLIGWLCGHRRLECAVK